MYFCKRVVAKVKLIPRSVTKQLRRDNACREKVAINNTATVDGQHRTECGAIGDSQTVSMLVKGTTHTEGNSTHRRKNTFLSRYIIYTIFFANMRTCV